MYIVDHYVRVDKDVLKKGDRLPENVPEEKIKWLLKAGAIHKVAPAAQPDEEEDALTYGLPVDPESEQISEEEMDEAPLQESEMDTGDEEEDDFGEEDTEVDVMAGIVTEKEDDSDRKTQAKAVRKSGRKQTGGKK